MLMSESFYADFEREFRGSRDLIKERLKVYLPFLSSLIEYDHQFTAVDLGCGRGEWLELLRDCGYDAYGVDIDDKMLDSCRDLNLNVEVNDAISCLSALRDKSINVVSLFHLVEHLEFADLKLVIFEAYRVLVPGGLLILETPNPENIRVASESFYTDPTHVRPIPPSLLQFILRHQGFSGAHILRLNSQLNLKQHRKVTLLDVLTHVSPDYAVIGLKDGPKELLQTIHQQLTRVEGFTLEMLAERFEADQKIELERLHEQVKDLETLAQVHRLEASRLAVDSREEFSEYKQFLADTHAQLLELQAQVQQDLEVIKHTQEFLADLLVRVDATQHALQSMYASTSWRVTRPLRWVGDHFLNPLGMKGRGTGSNVFTKANAKALFRLTIPRQSRFDQFISKLRRRLRIFRSGRINISSSSDKEYLGHTQVSTSYMPDQFAKPLDPLDIMTRIHQRIK